MTTSCIDNIYDFVRDCKASMEQFHWHILAYYFGRKNVLTVISVFLVVILEIADVLRYTDSVR